MAAEMFFLVSGARDCAGPRPDRDKSTMRRVKRNRKSNRPTKAAQPPAAPSGIRIRNAIACSSMMMLAVNPTLVGAVGLGEMQVKSSLGQPLAATVPLRLAAGETLSKDCVGRSWPVLSKEFSDSAADGQCAGCGFARQAIRTGPFSARVLHMFRE